jgi:general secretion pathway protein D
MEVKLDRDRNLGFSYHGGQLAGEKRDTTVLGSLGHDGLSSLLGVPLGGMSVGVLGPKLEGSGALLGKGPDGKALPEVPAFGVVFNAMQANGDLDLLSAPHLLTMDNEEAELHVGEIIPVRTGASSLGTAGAQLGALATLIPPGVDRKDVGVKLKLTPTVGAGDSVRLKLRQEVSDVVAEDFGGLGAKTSQRLISTNVTLRDRQTIAIGGLMSDHRSKTVSKVPLLGDIPILGRLFQRERVVTRKTNLLVVLTPHIVRDAADLTTMLRAKLRERQEFVRRFLGRQERLGLRAIDYRYKRGLLGELAALSSTLDEEAARHGEGAAARGPSAVRVRPRPPASRPAE